MQSTFFGMNIALQGLYSARGGMNVTNHNVANAYTRGYSRQMIQQRATTPIALNNGKGMLGTGTEVYGIKQMRDVYLDKKYWSQSSVLGEYSAKKSTSTQLETIFNATSADANFEKEYNNFYDALQKVSTNPSDASYLSVLKQNGASFTQYFNDLSAKLKSQQEDLNFNVKATVEQINSMASQIQSINRQIYKSELDGSAANDLRDQRAVIVDDLSLLANIKVNENDKGEFRVSLNGQPLVEHFDVNLLEIKPREMKDYTTETDFVNDIKVSSKYINIGTTPPPTANQVTKAFEEYKQDCENYRRTNVDGLYDIYWKNSGVQLDTADNGLSGQLKGYLDMRDGNNNLISGGNAGLDKTMGYKGVPYYMERMNTFVQTFAKLMNEGKSYNGTQLAEKGGFANGTTGIGFFSYKNPDGTYNTGNIDGTDGKPVIDYSKITASNFSISAEIDKDPKNISTTYDSATDKENNNLILQIIELKHNNSSFSEGKISDYMTAVTTDLAINTSQAKTFEKSQGNILMSVENQRLSISGVNLDEEMANMIKYNQIYGAASKMIATMNDIYNTTINKLGA